MIQALITYSNQQDPAFLQSIYGFRKLAQMQVPPRPLGGAKTDITRINLSINGIFQVVPLLTAAAHLYAQDHPELLANQPYVFSVGGINLLVSINDEGTVSVTKPDVMPGGVIPLLMTKEERIELIDRAFQEIIENNQIPDSIGTYLYENLDQTQLLYLLTDVHDRFQELGFTPTVGEMKVDVFVFDNGAVNIKVDMDFLSLMNDDMSVNIDNVSPTTEDSPITVQKPILTQSAIFHLQPVENPVAELVSYELVTSEDGPQFSPDLLTLAHTDQLKQKMLVSTKANILRGLQKCVEDYRKTASGMFRQFFSDPDIDKAKNEILGKFHSKAVEICNNNHLSAAELYGRLNAAINTAMVQNQGIYEKYKKLPPEDGGELEKQLLAFKQKVKSEFKVRKNGTVELLHGIPLTTEDMVVSLSSSPHPH